MDAKDLKLLGLNIKLVVYEDLSKQCFTTNNWWLYSNKMNDVNQLTTYTQADYKTGFSTVWVNKMYKQK